MMPEPFSMIELLRGFVSNAAELGIEYMVTGSFAMSVYGEMRSTRDIDIVVQLNETHIRPLLAAYTGDFYVSDNSIRRAIRDHSMFNIVNTRWGAKLDCIIQKDTEFARKSFDRRQKAAVSAIEFWTTTKEDLIIAKLDWSRESHSEMQIRDIANLTSTEYDSEYVNSWIPRLGLQGIWDEVEEWKIRRQRSEP
jgi:hypothetical protein